jgi:3-oxoadipate enol-lactonase
LTVPFIDLRGERFHYRFDGPESAPVVVLSNSLGTDLTMWDPQISALTQRFRVLRYDTRGHGASPVTPGPYRIAQLADDVINLLDALGVHRASFCGLSMGGATGMRLALGAASRFDKIILCNTAARIGTDEFWNARIAALRRDGLAPAAQTLPERWFTAAYRERAPKVVEAVCANLLRQSAAGYIACCEAIRDHDERETIAGIRLPTLVIAGTHDVPTPPADGRFLASRIAGARYVELNASHLSNIEAADEFNRAVLDFLAS